MCKACGCCHKSQIAEINAGPRERNNVFVSIACGAEGCASVNTAHRIDAQGNVGEVVPSQLATSALLDSCGCRSEIVLRIDHLDAGETLRVLLSAEEAGAQQGADEPATVTVDIKEGEQADMSLGGELFTSYVVKPGIARPFCYPVVGPHGLNIVRDIVFLPEGEKGTSSYAGVDHIHHKGIWIAQGDVNGTDNWSETEGHGRTINRKLTVDSEGPLFGQLHAVGDWVDDKGNKILEEDTFIRVYDTPDTARIMDLTTVWTATEGGVFFGDTKEAGTVSIRLQESMEEREGGTIQNAFGALGEAENWGKAAPWVDYYGPLEGSVCGVTIMDHPTNFRYPTTWHVRSYGLFTANQWGLHDFTGDNAKRGDYALPAGQSLCFRFRLFIHEGDTVTAGVGEQYLNWAFPPEVKCGE